MTALNFFGAPVAETRPVKASIAAMYRQHVVDAVRKGAQRAGENLDLVDRTSGQDIDNVTVPGLRDRVGQISDVAENRDHFIADGAHESPSVEAAVVCQDDVPAVDTVGGSLGVASGSPVVATSRRDPS